ncbi:MAG: hypothetical protein ABSE77_23630 [Acidimicrobiales bacterium]|jgi:hypothetical protein
MRHYTRWSRRRSRAEAELVKDAEAFFAGGLAERIESRIGTVPVWAWTNLLAHGTEDELGSESSRASPPWGDPAREWRQARSYLATDVLHRAEVNGSLAEVQRVVLVPLELKLASTPEVAGWSPGRWVMTVEAALTEQHQVGQRG